MEKALKALEKPQHQKSKTRTAIENRGRLLDRRLKQKVDMLLAGNKLKDALDKYLSDVTHGDATQRQSGELYYLSSIFFTKNKRIKNRFPKE